MKKYQPANTFQKFKVVVNIYLNDFVPINKKTLYTYFTVINVFFISAIITLQYAMIWFKDIKF